MSTPLVGKSDLPRWKRQILPRFKEKYPTLAKAMNNDLTPPIKSQLDEREHEHARIMAEIKAEVPPAPEPIDHIRANVEALKEYAIRAKVHGIQEEKKNTAVATSIGAINWLITNIDAKVLTKLSEDESFVSAVDDNDLCLAWKAIIEGLSESGTAKSLAAWKTFKEFANMRMKDTDDIVGYIDKWNECRMLVVEYDGVHSSELVMAMQFVESLAPRYGNFQNAMVNAELADEAVKQVQRVARNWTPLATTITVTAPEVAAVLKESKPKAKGAKPEIRHYTKEEWEKLSDEDQDEIKQGFADRRRERRMRKKKPMKTNTAQIQLADNETHFHSLHLDSEEEDD
jgi:hypothetical protein